MELDLKSLFVLHACAHLYSMAETPQSPPPPHLGSYTRALLVSQDRRHLYVAPCLVAIPTYVVRNSQVPTIRRRIDGQKSADSHNT